MSVKFDFKSLETGFKAVWPVNVNVPQDGGGIEVQTFDAVFLALTPEETEEAQKANDPNAWPGKFWIGLSEVEPAEFTEALRKKFLDRAYVRQALITAYIQFMQGIPAKN
jgi:hypothetical protein